MDKEGGLSKTTIVGGQPDNIKSIIPGINNSIENILMKAASDEEFKEKLLNDRLTVLEEESSLNHIDKNMLQSIPSSSLNSMIEKFTGQITSRRNFLKGAAASAALLAGAFVLSPSMASNLTPAPPGGARPDPPLLTGKIGTDGGTVDYNYTGLQIIIPPKALSESVNISIRVILPPSKTPENVCFFGEVYEFSPEDICFSKEITVKFPAPYCSYDVIKAYCWKKSEWLSLPVESSTETTGYEVAKIKNFGIYTLGYEINTPVPTRVPVTRGIDPQ
jgi:hypothetical protein